MSSREIITWVPVRASSVGATHEERIGALLRYQKDSHIMVVAWTIKEMFLVLDGTCLGALLGRASSVERPKVI